MLFMDFNINLICRSLTMLKYSGYVELLLLLCVHSSKCAYEKAKLFDFHPFFMLPEKTNRFVFSGNINNIVGANLLAD